MQKSWAGGMTHYRKMPQSGPPVACRSCFRTFAAAEDLGRVIRRLRRRPRTASVGRKPRPRRNQGEIYLSCTRIYRRYEEGGRIPGQRAKAP